MDCFSKFSSLRPTKGFSFISWLVGNGVVILKKGFVPVSQIIHLESCFILMVALFVSMGENSIQWAKMVCFGKWHFYIIKNRLVKQLFSGMQQVILFFLGWLLLFCSSKFIEENVKAYSLVDYVFTDALKCKQIHIYQQNVPYIKNEYLYYYFWYILPLLTLCDSIYPSAEVSTFKWRF